MTSPSSQYALRTALPNIIKSVYSLYQRPSSVYALPRTTCSLVAADFNRTCRFNRRVLLSRNYLRFLADCFLKTYLYEARIQVTKYWVLEVPAGTCQTHEHSGEHTHHFNRFMTTPPSVSQQKKHRSYASEDGDLNKKTSNLIPTRE